MRFVDLFCGAGLFTQGLKDAGLEHVVGVEIDRTAAGSYRLNHEHVICGDVRDVTASSYDFGEVDVLVASCPCQSFSSMGKRKPGDDRDDLFREVARIAGFLNPKVILLENVAGLLTKKDPSGTPIMHKIHALFRDAGYDLEWHVMNAKDHGVPQSRKRVFLQANRLDIPVAWPEKLPGPPPAIGPHLADRIHVPSRYFWSPRRQVQLQARAAKATKGGFGRIRVLSPDEPSTTITACYGQNLGIYGCIRYDSEFQYGSVFRKLMPSEIRKLFTVPDDYILAGSEPQVYRQLGNAVPCKMAEALGRTMLSQYSRTDENYQLMERPCTSS